MFQVLEITMMISALSYWLVGKGYDVGRWVKLVPNLALTGFILYGAASAHNLRPIIVVIAMIPLIWPTFLLLAFRRPPQ